MRQMFARLMGREIKVFVVDDSAVVRKVMSTVLGRDPEIRVIGTAPDPIFAIEKMRKDWPDVVTLDVEMPRMDGITFLGKLMAERPTPVVICSSLTTTRAVLPLRFTSMLMAASHQELGNRGQHLSGLEGLDHPGLGARLLACFLFFIGAFGGKHDYRHELVSGVLFHFLNKSDAVHVGHIDVADDQVDLLSAGQLGQRTGLLKEHGIQISMDGKGCWRDNVFVERLWKSVKYEEVYLKAYDSVSVAKASRKSSIRAKVEHPFLILK